MSESVAFENKLAELETIVKALEEGNIPLDTMVALYEKGMLLGKECLHTLEAYEGKIELLRKEKGGEADGEL